MLENAFGRAGVFSVVALVIPVALGAYFGDMDQGIQIGVVMGIVFGVVSQFFEPKTESVNRARIREASYLAESGAAENGSTLDADGVGTAVRTAVFRPSSVIHPP